jgi:hypothetical protein
MKIFIVGVSRTQVTLRLTSLDDYISEDNPIRLGNAFIKQVTK